MGDRAINKEIELHISTTSEAAVRKSNEKHGHYINVNLSETEINHFTLQGCVISMCDINWKNSLPQVCEECWDGSHMFGMA